VPIPRNLVLSELASQLDNYQLLKSCYLYAHEHGQNIVKDVETISQGLIN